MVKSEKLLRTELIISNLLRYGVILCGGIIALGVLLSWLNAPNLHRFSAATLPALISGEQVNIEVPRSLAEFSAHLSAFDPSAIIALGLLFLIALPTVRVALTVVLFFIERDFTYFVITLIVLTVLLSGMILGKAL